MCSVVVLVAVLSKGSGGASSSAPPPWLPPLNETDKTESLSIHTQRSPPSLASQPPTTSKTAVKRLAGREARSTIFFVFPYKSLRQAS
ncbi:hypothetical protein TB1_042230 [Malus domestica]